mmetsp:Transcript_4966/g.17271  ORF Transcript_4966/g.17271 Transcript_4966/m.17271 type:complete len:97 (+) Transcript_4966:216-506(+)
MTPQRWSARATRTDDPSTTRETCLAQVYQIRRSFQSSRARARAFQHQRTERGGGGGSRVTAPLNLSRVASSSEREDREEVPESIRTRVHNLFLTDQ